MKADIGPRVIDELVHALIEEVNLYNPDKVKADYERVMSEAGLITNKLKIWVPKNEGR